METWSIVTAVLVAVLVGAALPVLFELFRTLRELRRVLRNADARLEPAIREIEGTARHARKIGDALEPHVGAAADAVGAVAGLARPLREIQGHLESLAGMFAAIVPALVAALGAYRRASGDGRKEHDAADADPSAARESGDVEVESVEITSGG